MQRGYFCRSFYAKIYCSVSDALKRYKTVRNILNRFAVKIIVEIRDFLQYIYV